MKEFAKLLGKTIRLVDVRTGVSYSATIEDFKHEWGALKLQCNGSKLWFVPTRQELESVGELNLIA